MIDPTTPRPDGNRYMWILGIGMEAHGNQLPQDIFDYLTDGLLYKRPTYTCREYVTLGDAMHDYGRAVRANQAPVITPPVVFPCPHCKAKVMAPQQPSIKVIQFKCWRCGKSIAWANRACVLDTSMLENT